MVEKYYITMWSLPLFFHQTFKRMGLNFLLPTSFLQLAYMKHPTGYQIVPHTHNKIDRNVQYTIEHCSLKREGED